MWTLTEKPDGSFLAEKYTIKGMEKQSIRIVQDSKAGSLQEVANFLLSFENIGIKDIEVALEMMDETGDDTCEFGIFGSPIFTKNTQLSAVA